MPSPLSYYGYSDCGTILLSTKQLHELRQSEKDSEQDERIQQNFNDNQDQQVEIDKNTQINDTQVQQINSLVEQISHITVGGAVRETNFSIRAEGDKYVVSFQCMQNGIPVIPRECKVTRSVNGGEPETVMDLEHTSSASTSVNVSGCVEYYKLEVTPDVEAPITTISEVTMYMYFVGASETDEITYSEVAAFTKVYGHGEKVDAYQYTGNNQYIWICTPTERHIDYITSNGITVTMYNGENQIMTPYGWMKCKRSQNALDTAGWPLMIYFKED